MSSPVTDLDGEVTVAGVDEGGTCCRRCEDKALANDPDGWLHRTFIVCSKCGNKRCPKATNHELTCTNSNATGQPGSDYE